MYEKMVIMKGECDWLCLTTCRPAATRGTTRGVETLKLLGFFHRYPRAAGNACPNWCPLFTIYKQPKSLITCSHLFPPRSSYPRIPHIPHIVYTAPKLSSLSQHSQIQSHSSYFENSVSICPHLSVLSTLNVARCLQWPHASLPSIPQQRPLGPPMNPHGGAGFAARVPAAIHHPVCRQ